MSGDDDWRRRHTDPNDLSSPFWSSGPSAPVSPEDIRSPLYHVPGFRMNSWDPHVAPATLFRVAPWTLVACVVAACIAFLWAIGDHKAAFTILAVGAALTLVLLVAFRMARRRC